MPLPLDHSLSGRRVNWSLKLWRCVLSSLAPPQSFSVRMNQDLAAVGIRCLNRFEVGGSLLTKPGSWSMETESLCWDGGDSPLSMSHDTWKHPPLLIHQPKCSYLKCEEVCQATSFCVRCFPVKKQLFSGGGRFPGSLLETPTCRRELLPSYPGSPSLQGYPSVNLHELKYLLFILP